MPQELHGVPDKVQYDSDDSFIDDTELVGNMAIIKMMMVTTTLWSNIDSE